MKDNNLALVCDHFDLQITSCDKVLGVHMNDNLTWANHFSMFQKDIIIPMTFVTDK